LNLGSDGLLVNWDARLLKEVFFALYKFPGKVGKFDGKLMINKGKSGILAGKIF